MLTTSVYSLCRLWNWTWIRTRLGVGCGIGKAECRAWSSRGINHAALSPIETFRSVAYSGCSGVEFAILQEMNTRIGPHGKLECFCVLTICEQCKNSCFQTSLEGGPIGLFISNSTAQAPAFMW